MIASLTVVVIGRNEGARLAHSLQSVRQMRLDGWHVELIYVDSCSADDSVAVARAHGFTPMLLDTARPTAAKARNLGWRAGSGELVLFLDGDTILQRDFVAESVDAFDDPEIAVIWGHRRELHPEASIYNRVLDLDWMYAPGWTQFCGGDALFRRSVLQQANGFDEALIAGEEPELCRRILAAGYRILHVDRAMTLHDMAMTNAGQYWSRAVRAGHAYAEVSARFRKSAQPFWNDEVKRNRSRAGMLMVLAVLGVMSSVALRSVWPVVCAFALLLLLAARSGWRARWKSNNPVTLFLYGLHSQLQQVPIYCGQRAFARDQRRGRQSPLMEYK